MTLDDPQVCEACGRRFWPVLDNTSPVWCPACIHASDEEGLL